MSVLSYIKKFHDENNFEHFDQNLITTYKLLNSNRPYMIITYIYTIPDLDFNVDSYLLDNELYLTYKTNSGCQFILKINSHGVNVKEIDYNHDERAKIKKLLFGENNQKYTDISTILIICDRRYDSKAPSKYTHLYMDYKFIRIINEHQCVNIPNENPDSYLSLMWGSKVVSAHVEGNKLHINIYDIKLSKQFIVCWPYMMNPDSAMIYNDCLYISDCLLKRMMVVNLITGECIKLKTVNELKLHYDYFQCADDGTLYIICNNVIAMMKLPPWEMAVVIGEPIEKDIIDMINIQCCDGVVSVEKKIIYGINYFATQMEFNKTCGRDLPLSVSYSMSTMVKLFEVIQYQPNLTLQDNLDLFPVADYLRADFAYQIILSNILIEGYNISCFHHIPDMNDMNNNDIEDIILKWIYVHRSDVDDEQIEQLRSINKSFINKIFRGEIGYRFELITVDDILMWCEY